MELTGSQIVIECLKEQGVDTVFGYPGGTMLNIYDELYRHPEIHHILTSHEQGAAHAADGYARATGKTGVCMATSGPGATNLVTGIATAYMDSTPMVAITCNVGKALLGKDSFQEIDIAGVAMPITKYSVIVKDITVLADTLRRAFTIAKSGRPGPVLVDITKDVTAATYEYEPKTPEKIEPFTERITEEGRDHVVSLIQESKRPYIFVGGGSIISGASEEVRELAHRIQAPVCDTLMGKGAFPGTDELYTGMLGMHGTKTSNYGVTKCDLLIVLGARFSDRVTGNAAKFANNAKIVQIDVDAAEINKNVVVESSIIGDVKEVLKRLNAKLEPMHHDEWIAENMQGEASTVAELREKIHAMISDRKTIEYRHFKNLQSAKALAERFEGEISDAIYDAVTADVLVAFEDQLAEQNMSKEDFLRSQGVTEQQLKRHLNGQVHEQLVRQFALDAVAEHFNLELTDDDLNEYFRAAATPGLEAMIRLDFERNGKMPEARLSAMRLKANDYVTEHATIHIEG